MFRIFSLLSVILVLATGCSKSKFDRILLNDNFSALDTGLFFAPVGAHTEYHFLPEAAPKGNWVVTSFASGDLWGSAWQVKQEGTARVMCQTLLNKSQQWTHPMIISGDSLWRNYTLKVKFSAENNLFSSGIAFRYLNDRCFYFFGVRDSMVYISRFMHSAKFNVLDEQLLAKKPFITGPGQVLNAAVTVNRNSIKASMDNVVLEAQDDTFTKGKIGLVSNSRAKYYSVEVLTSDEEIINTEELNAGYQLESVKLQEANPKMVVWKKIDTEGFGAGRNVRFGDINGDGTLDILIGQVIHHGPRDSHSELSCLTAMTFDGEILWQKGTPDPEKYNLTNDVGFQIHDLNNDGKNEIIYTMNFEIIVADAKTGKTLRNAPLPKSKIVDDKFERILGDCLFFFDAEGKGWDSDILTKDRYNNFWVMDSRLNMLWEGSCKTGHYPYAYDIDNDGKDELAIGYSLYDHDGRLLWCLDKELEDHCDGVAVTKYTDDAGSQPVIMYSASNEGYLRVSPDGKILLHTRNGHVQNPAIANFRSDLPGLETVTIDFWGSQGIIHLYDSNGRIYHDLEPNQYGSMCLPLNWTGNGEEYFVHNPDILYGGIYDGWGRKVLQFPDDDHPEMCNATLDLTGDCRDEIVVWDQHRLWVYTQSDNPRSGRLYKPVRNPLYNYSNYQATVSLPGWSE
jgi:rhamnogalacturonan endolyase